RPPPSSTLFPYTTLFRSRTVGQSDGDIVLGASLTLTELSDSPTVRQSVEVVSRAAELVSTPLLRNMGTLGGNLCLDTRCNYYDQDRKSTRLNSSHRTISY